MNGKQNSTHTEDPERTATDREVCRRLLELDSTRARHFVVYGRCTFARVRTG